MNAPTEIQTIRDAEGNPAFVVVPYDLFLREYARRNDLIPNEVVGATVEGASPMKAWREHLRLTQSEVADRLGVSQSAYAQTETATRPRKTTLSRVAEALGISLEQLDF